MAGIYIHIPYCRQPCYYCNFHFKASQRDKDAFLDAIYAEIGLRQDFFQGLADFDGIKTLYIGGGTPSVLSVPELVSVFDRLQEHFSLDGVTEVTLEGNPDDLSLSKLADLKQHTPVNRLSVGIQSFFADDLVYMNRIHTPGQAEKSLENAMESGFLNITADLIYGTPTMSDASWQDNLRHLVAAGVPHISAYALTVEEKTPLEYLIRKGKAAPVDDAQAGRQFDLMCDFLDQHGYRHYEISNFARKGYESRHNMSYWTGVPYLGLGPSAHSYIQGTRSWNVANTRAYIKDISQGIIPCQGETLSDIQALNEYIMTSLRTMWGCDLTHVHNKWGSKYMMTLKQKATSYLRQGLMHNNEEQFLVLTRKGQFFADGIAADLFFQENDIKHV